MVQDRCPDKILADAEFVEKYAYHASLKCMDKGNGKNIPNVSSTRESPKDVKLLRKGENENILTLPEWCEANFSF